MKNLRFVLPALLLLGHFFSHAADSIGGSNMSNVLGAHKDSSLFTQFKAKFELDSRNENPARGIKFYWERSSGLVYSFMVTNDGFEVNEQKFAAFTDSLPFGISILDDSTALIAKLGRPKRVSEDFLRFVKDSLQINVAFKSLRRGKISFIRFQITNEPVSAPPMLVQSGEREGGGSTTAAEVKPISDIEATRRRLEAQMNEPAKQEAKATTPSTTQQPTITEAKPTVKRAVTGFRENVSEVLRSGSDTYFESTKSGARSGGNFWNYQFTYNTTIRIPGEKYNFLYRFPFETSQLDFVSVLYEADGYTPQFDRVYNDYEQKLIENFPLREGWTISYERNKESNTLRDLHLSNEKEGVIVLDYSRNPRGRCVLYLRFLLVYD